MSWRKYTCSIECSLIYFSDRRGRDRMVVGFTTTYVISAYHHWSCEFETRLWRDVLDTTLCDEICQWLATGRCFYPGNPVSSTNKTDRHDITEILLNVALITITLTLYILWIAEYNFVFKNRYKMSVHDEDIKNW